MNERAVVTFATGDYQQLLEISRPGLEEYSKRHGYHLQTKRPSLSTRPPSWMKIPLLLALLDEYRELLWVDCDVVVCDPTKNLTEEVPDQAWQAMVRHATPDGQVPNCGVWLVRQAMAPHLERLWGMKQYLQHPWWEQGAMCELLGYVGNPSRLANPTELYWRTHWLGLEWNSHEQRDRHPTPRFAHATHGPLGWRMAVMHQRVNEQPATAGKRGA